MPNSWWVPMVPTSGSERRASPSLSPWSYTIVALLLSRSAVLERLQCQAHWLDRASGVVLIAMALRVVTL